MDIEMRHAVTGVTLFLAVCACSQAKESATGGRYLTVVYADFSVDPISGYHIADLEREGCRFEISENSLKSTILKRVTRSDFHEDDLKAEVFGAAGGSMEIDDGGVLSDKSGYFIIDRERFEKALIPAGKCSIRTR